MARPKKYKSETEVISFRVPKEFKAIIQKKVLDVLKETTKAANDLVDFGTIITHTSKDGTSRHVPITSKEGQNVLANMPLGYGHPVADKIEIDEWRKKAEERIKELEKQIANPPKDLSIPMRIYRTVRENEIASIKKQF